MKKFVFSMQKILELREFEEEQAKIELGKAITETNRIQQELEVIAAERVKMISVCENSSVQDMVINERYITRLDLSRDRLLEELAAAQLIVDEKRQLFSEAMKNRKVLSKLKEKQLATYKKDLQINEDNNIDDFASAKFQPSI